MAGFGGLWTGLKKAKAYLAMMLLQFGFAWLNIITALVLMTGMSHYVLSVYRHAVAFLAIAPFAFILERNVRPNLTLPIFLRIMALGMLEPVLDQNLYNEGITHTSATMGASFANMLPTITFILAMIFRLEKVNVKKLHGVAKVVGTVITVMGAMLMTLYTGPAINFNKSVRAIQNTTETGDKHHRFIGILCLIGGICSASGFFILQSFTLKKYPAALSLAALVCLMGTVEGAVVSLIFERDMIVWRVGLNYRLLVVAYSGVICSGLAYYVQGVVIKERGPVFITSFTPLSLIMTAALGATVLKELVYLGSILGGIFIVGGLYIVVWGKSKESQSTPEQTNQEGPVVAATNTSSSEEDEIEELPVDHGGIVNDPEGEIQELPIDNEGIVHDTEGEIQELPIDNGGIVHDPEGEIQELPVDNGGIVHDPEGKIQELPVSSTILLQTTLLCNVA